MSLLLNFILNTKFLYTILVIIASVYLYIRYSLSYWQRRKVYSPPSKSWFGHFVEDMADIHIGIKVKQIYFAYKDKPFIGLHMLFFQKQFFVNDLELVKNVLSKDYSYFEGHGFPSHKSSNPLDQNLFHLVGEEWKKMRIKFNSTLTSNKIKYMFETVYKYNLEMIEYLKDEIKDGKDVSAKDLITKLGTNVVTSIAMGMESNSFKDPDSIFVKMENEFLEVSMWGKLFHLFSFIMPKVMKHLPLARLPRSLTKKFSIIVKDTIKYRENNNIERRDFLQLLIERKNSPKSPDYRITMDDIIPHVYGFFVTGFETSSMTIQYALLELAMNPHIRDKLVKELDEAVAKNNGEITYELVHGLGCLNEVADETLRMHPPLTVLTRGCTKDYKVPNTDLVIEKGTLVIIPVMGIHYDPDIYPEPERFLPERFSAENKKTRHNFAHLPFGEGPRICIANRFAYIQIKLALLSILLNFNIEVSPKTELPIRYDPNAMLLHPEGDMTLRFTPRNK